MNKVEIGRIKSPYRDDMIINGYTFGKGQEAACIIGSMRGTEVQQTYICSKIVSKLKELEHNGNISANKKILVIPTVNPYALNTGRKFWGVEDEDINRAFPGREAGKTNERIAMQVMEYVKNYTFGIQFASFYVDGEFVPHVRMMETGYQNTSLANLFGLPFVVVRKPQPIDTTTLNFNWQNDMTAAFSVYSGYNDSINEEKAVQSESAVLRFLTRMGIIRYDSLSGFISHVIEEDSLANVYAARGGFIRKLKKIEDEVMYGEVVAEVLDPFEGYVKEQIKAPTEGIVFFAEREPLVNESDVIYKIVRRIHK